MRVIHLVRKPLEKSSVAANILEHGTGALNIDGSRTDYAAGGLEAIQKKNPGRGDTVTSNVYGTGRPQQTVSTKGRWPNNVVLQHLPGCRTVGCEPGCPVADLDIQSGDRPVSGAARAGRPAKGGDTGAATVAFGIEKGNGTLHADSGGASRYFKQVDGG